MKAYTEDYEKRAEERWGDTPAFGEYRNKNSRRSAQENEALRRDMKAIFSAFAALDCAPEAAPSQALVKTLQDFISEHFYTCTNQILAGLGTMYAAEGEFKQNIDEAAGAGTAEYVSKAIAAYTK